MITRAIITSIFGNKCTVKVPLFANDNSNEIPTISDVVMSIPPGMTGQYAENDVVFLGFEENMLNRPVILGKLYTGSNSAQKIPASAITLGTKIDYHNVEGQANLQITQIISDLLNIENEDGKVNVQTIQSIADLLKVIQSLQMQINMLNAKISLSNQQN